MNDTEYQQYTTIKLKCSILFETDRILSFLFRLKLECEKLAQEKTEMQRHYVMVSGIQRI